jgi:hypothetical protein
MITIQFSTDNAAFQENPSEIQVVLDTLAFELKRSQPGDSGVVKDSNGNSIGTWTRS